MVVKKLVEQLNLPIKIIACPIVREKDGLAMSSRNTRLNPEERKTASLIPVFMDKACQIVKTKGIEAAKFFIKESVSKVPEMKLDYYEVCDAETLDIITDFNSSQPAVSLIAVFVGKIRLIDNWRIN
jgi:pantoate--beta-alanine ligase